METNQLCPVVPPGLRALTAWSAGGTLALIVQDTAGTPGPKDWHYPPKCQDPVGAITTPLYLASRSHLTFWLKVAGA